MTKKRFVEIIAALDKQYQKDKMITGKLEAFCEAFCPDANVFITGYNNFLITNQLVQILQDEMDDCICDSWIEYFMFEIDFGRDYKPGCVTNGKIEIDLSTAGRLYDYLTTQKMSNRAK